jgi:hypothetical protein
VIFYYVLKQSNLLRKRKKESRLEIREDSIIVVKIMVLVDTVEVTELWDRKN